MFILKNAAFIGITLEVKVKKRGGIPAIWLFIFKI